MVTELEKMVEEFYCLVDEIEDEEYPEKMDAFLSRMYSYVKQKYDDSEDFHHDLHEACVKVGRHLGRHVVYSSLADMLAGYSFSLLPPEEQRGIYL